LPLLFAAIVFWISALVVGLIGRLPWDWWNGNEQEKASHQSRGHRETVLQKVLTWGNYRPHVKILTTMGLLTLHDEANPGHGRRKIVQPLAEKYELVATI